MLDSYTLPGVSLMAVALGLLAVQLWYWLAAYGRIPGWHASPRCDKDAHPAVSVVVVIHSEYYVEHTLPLLLAQQYDPYEVVVVDMSGSEDVASALAALGHRHANLHITRMVQQPRRTHISPKMALNVGIKAARYPNVLLTTADARPVSAKWVSLMARGFSCGDVVLGYCGIERTRGLGNALLRAGRFHEGLNFLSAAIRNRPFRGIAQNVGYTARLYFSARGFDHLNIDGGDDDLFLQRIMSPEETCVVMNPHATMRQKVWGGNGDWFRRRVRERRTRGLYPAWARSYIEWELGSRVLLMAACATLMACMPLEVALAAAGALALRLTVVEVQVVRTGRRLGERALAWPYIIYDIFSPLYLAAVWIAGLFARRRWR